MMEGEEDVKSESLLIKSSDSGKKQKPSDWEKQKESWSLCFYSVLVKKRKKTCSAL